MREIENDSEAAKAAVIQQHLSRIASYEKRYNLLAYIFMCK